MKSAIVVNCSAPQYNLGAAKLADWLHGQGCIVQRFNDDPGLFVFGADLVCLSVIFSWHAPLAREIALRSKPHAEVWCGGPAMYKLADWWKRETGLECNPGLDWRFERQRGDYRFSYSSRGCPMSCSFCAVWKIEGQQFQLDWEFQPAPFLCDSNLSALPVDFQEHVVRRYQESDVRLMDANSGFEPHSFTIDTRRRWEKILRGPWRWGFDEMDEANAALAMFDVLADVPPRRKQVYCMVGNEPIAACYERASKIIERGGEPYCQAFIPHNAIEKKPLVRFDWTAGLLRDFCRYFNRHLWRSIPIREYSDRQGETPPFALAEL